MTLDPADFEAGENVTHEFERSKARGGIVVSARLAPDDARFLAKLAEDSDRTISQIARLAIRRFIEAERRNRNEKDLVRLAPREDAS